MILESKRYQLMFLHVRSQTFWISFANLSRGFLSFLILSTVIGWLLVLFFDQIYKIYIYHGYGVGGAVEKIHLSEEGKGVLAISSQEVNSSKEHTQFNILFKLQATKEFNKEAFKSTIQKLWCSSQGVTTKGVGKNLFLASFVYREDMMDVLDRSPWSFNRKLILLKRFNGDISPSSVSFQYFPF